MHAPHRRPESGPAGKAEKLAGSFKTLRPGCPNLRSNVARCECGPDETTWPVRPSTIPSIHSARLRWRWPPICCGPPSSLVRIPASPTSSLRNRPRPTSWDGSRVRKLPRQAAVTLFDCKTGATHVATVDLGSRQVTAWREHPTKVHPYGQPPVTIEEVFKVGDIVKADAGWRHAMKRRGLTDEDIELVQVDPFSAGYFDREVEKGRRLVSAVSFWRRGYQGQWLCPSDRRRGRAGRSDRGQGRPARGRAGNRSDPEAVSQLRPRVDPENARGRQAARHRAEGRSRFLGRGLEGFLAELVVPRRLDGARRPRAASDRVSATAGASGRSSIGPASPT